MACWKSAWILVVVAVISTLLSSIHATEIGGGVGRRILLSFKETPHGSNFTFDCSPSGPCVPCAYSEKDSRRYCYSYVLNFGGILCVFCSSDENYRCSETGYRIPFKCIEIEHDTKNENGKQHSQNGRSAAEISDNLNPHISLRDAASNEGRILLDGSSPAKDGAQIYITYRSCIAANAEKLSVLDFEGIILCFLLASGSVVYFRRKQTITRASGAGPGSIQMNSRF